MECCAPLKVVVGTPVNAAATAALGTLNAASAFPTFPPVGIKQRFNDDMNFRASIIQFIDDAASVLECALWYCNLSHLLSLLFSFFFLFVLQMSTRTLSRHIRSIRLTSLLSTSIRSFTATTTFKMPRDSKVSTEKPKHVPVHFPKMTSLSAKDIPHFRKVLWTGLFSQVVLMNIPKGGDIGEEVHLVDQALTFTQGELRPSFLIDASCCEKTQKVEG